MNQRLILDPIAIFSIVNMITGSDLHLWSYNLKKIEKQNPFQTNVICTVALQIFAGNNLWSSMGEGLIRAFYYWTKSFFLLPLDCALAKQRFSLIARKSTADSSQRTVAKCALKKLLQKKNKKMPSTADLWLSRKASWSYDSYLVLSTIGSNCQIPVDDSHLSS